MTYPFSPLDQPARLLAAADWAALETLLLDLEFLEAKVAAGYIRELHADLLAASEAIPADRPARHILPLLAEAIARNMNFIHDNREQYPQALFQCLWNLAWWYDNPASAPFYDAPFTGWLDGAPPWETPQHPLQTLLEEWHTQRQLRHPGFVWIKSLTPPGLPLASSFVAHLPTARDVRLVCFSPDGALLACVVGVSTVQVWDVATKQMLIERKFHPEQTDFLRFSLDSSALWVVPVFYTPPTRPEGPTLVTADLLFDWQTGVPRFSFDLTISHSIHLQPSPDETLICVVSDQLSIVEVATGRELWHRNTEFGAYKISFSHDSARLAITRHKKIDLVQARTGEILQTLHNPKDHFCEMLPRLAFSPDGRYVVSGLMHPMDFAPLPDMRDSEWSWGGLNNPNSINYAAGLWRVEDGKFLHSVNHEGWTMAAGAIFSPDSQSIAISHEDGSVSILEAETGNLRATFNDQSGQTRNIAYSADGSILAVASDNGVTLWNTALPRHVPSRVGHSMRVADFSVAPDATTAATASKDCSTLLWDSTTCRPRLRIHTPDYPHFKVSLAPDASKVAIASDNGIVLVYDTMTGERLVTWRAVEDDPVGNLVHSPDAALLATSGMYDHDICIWDARTGHLRIRLTGHTDYVDSVRFTADSSQLVSTSFDTTSRLWNLQTGKQERQFYPFADADALLPPPPGGPVATMFFNTNTPVRFARIEDQTVIAAYPSPIQALTPHPDGRHWTGSQGNHLIHLRLEGDISNASGYREQKESCSCYCGRSS